MVMEIEFDEMVWVGKDFFVIEKDGENIVYKYEESKEGYFEIDKVNKVEDFLLVELIGSYFILLK
jgi:hypothetical protein